MRKYFYTIMFLMVLLAGCVDAKDTQAAVDPVREDIEWLNLWFPHTNDEGLPRVLLIGNSITNAYYPEVSTLLEGKAYVSKLTTSKSIGDPALLAEVSLALSYEDFDIVHFNNGLHGWGYTDEEYQKSFPDLIETIKRQAPNARLIWATISPMRVKEQIEKLDPKTERIKKRNEIALSIVEKEGIRVDDLFHLVIDHPEFYAGGDGIHLVPVGVSAMAKQVAGIIEDEIRVKNR